MSQLASQRRTYAIFVGIVAAVLLGCLFYAKALRRNGPDAAVEKSPTATMVAAAATERRLLGAEATKRTLLPAATSARRSVYPPDVLQSIKKKNIIDLPRLDKSFASQMGDLEERAKNGDSQAALLLWNGLNQCAEITNGHAEKLLNDSGKPFDNDPSRILDNTGFVSSLLDNCAHVTDAQIAKRFDWLKQAAAEGDPQAQYYYAQAGPVAIGDGFVALQNPELWQDYRNTAINYFENLAEACNSSALSTLWDDYYHGNSLFAKNIKISYTYKLILDDLNPVIKSVGGLDASMEAVLTPDQIQEATQSANQFYNAYCQ